MTDLISETIVERFKTFAEEKRLAHAYLFVGPQGVGKSETALGVALYLNCQNPRDGRHCNVCPSCVRILKGSHPDVHIFEKLPDEETIKIEEVRKLISQIQLRPFEAALKIFIIKNIEDLTHEAGNALLKTLEEPSKQSLLLLTTSFPERIMETVKSRCQQVALCGILEDKLKAHLVGEYQMDQVAAHYLAYYSCGSLGRAVKLKDDDLIKNRDEAVDQFLFSQRSDPFIQSLSGDKTRTKEAMDILLMWFRDCLLLKLGMPHSKLINGDRLSDLARCQKSFSFEEISEAIDEIVKTSKSLADNFNLKIALSIIKEKLWRKL